MYVTMILLFISHEFLLFMKKVLLLGNGAREHILGETLKKNGAQIFTYGSTRNPGLLELSEDFEVGALNDFIHLRQYAMKVQPDFAFIGPDNPIADGAADLLLEASIPSVAPLKTVARLESSKSFTRALLSKYHIAGNPVFKVFYQEEGLAEFIQSLASGFVVKADGLMGGKGVKVSGDHLHNIEEGIAYALECLKAAGRVVIEEKFLGQEFSLMSFCDGTTTIEMPAVQDHKRAFEGDQGPNTGGMGSYSDANHLLPFLTQKDIDDARTITQQVAKALLQETGFPFQGIMYGGFIATANGVRLIEYNARFGDPEVLNVLPILESNFLDVCEAILSHDLKNASVKFSHKATVCKYIVPKGYPDNPGKGSTIKVHSLPLADTAKTDSNVKMYYASVDQTQYGLILGSSRSIAFVGIADTIQHAEQLAENACNSVEGSVFHRKDIGTKALLEKRIEMMKALRSV